jgi:serine/threonine protein phosphatase PrpC
MTLISTFMGMIGLRGSAEGGVYCLIRKSSSSSLPTSTSRESLAEATRRKLFVVNGGQRSNYADDASAFLGGRNKYVNTADVTTVIRILRAVPTTTTDVCVRDMMIKSPYQYSSRSYSLWSWRGGETTDGGTDGASSSKSSTSDQVQSSLSSSTKTILDTIVSSTSSSSSALSTSTSSSTGGSSPRTYRVSVSSEQGYRSYMEDEHYISNDGDFAAVFDGHGGPAVSRYLRKNLYANVQACLPRPTTTSSTPSSSLSSESESTEVLFATTSNSSSSSSNNAIVVEATVDDYATALESALDKVDREILRISHWSFQGSTAIVVWMHELRMGGGETDENGSLSQPTTTTTSQRTILAANIGDSRAVLCRNNTAWDLTRDHKPNDPTEKARIESLGGSVIWCGDTDKFGMPIEDRGIYRVNGNLALSRAIGDRSERPHVTAEPDVVSIPVQDDDEFIIVATDGLWDVMDSDEAVEYVRSLLDAGLKRAKVAAHMVEEAIRRGTYDNVTVVIIWID